MLKGVTSASQKCQKTGTPNFLQGVTVRAQQCRELSTLKGAVSASRQRHFSRVPTSFIWCRHDHAAMPRGKRSKGRVTISLQKCHVEDTLPTQFNGVIYPTRKRHRFVAPRGRVIRDPQKCLSIGALPSQFKGVTPWAQIAMYFSPPQITGDTDMTQQCLDPNSPRERSLFHRSNAGMKTPLPTSLTGAITTSQKCYKVNAPREGSPIGHSNVIRAAPFPPVTGGHQRHAEMPDDLRPHRIWAIGMPQKCH